MSVAQHKRTERRSRDPGEPERAGPHRVVPTTQVLRRDVVEQSGRHRRPHGLPDREDRQPHAEQDPGGHGWDDGRDRGHKPAARVDRPDHCQHGRARLALDPVDDEELRDHDDRGVAGIGDREPLDRQSGLLCDQDGQSYFLSTPPTPGRDERETHQGQQSTIAEHFAVATLFGMLLRGQPSSESYQRRRRTEVRQIRQRVQSVQEHEAGGVGLVDDDRADQTSEPDPQIQQHELHPVGALTLRTVDQSGDQRGLGRPEVSSPEGVQARDEERRGDVLDEGEARDSGGLDQQTLHQDRPRPEAVDQPADRGGEHELQARHPRDHQARGRGGDTADVVQVHDQQRDGQTVAHSGERQAQKQAFQWRGHASEGTA